MLYRKGQIVTAWVGGFVFLLASVLTGAVHFSQSPISALLTSFFAGVTMAAIRKFMYTFHSLDYYYAEGYRIKKQTPFYRALNRFLENKDYDGNAVTSFVVFLFWNLVFRMGEVSVTVGVVALIQLSGRLNIPYFASIVTIESIKMLYLSCTIALLASAFAVGFPNRNMNTYGRLGNPQDLP